MQWKPNVTVAAIARVDDRFLLVEENADGRIVFNQPAGHIEENETLLDAVKREVLEETAWRFQPRGLSGIYLFRNARDGITYLRFCFAGECLQRDENRGLDEGIIRTAWLTIDEIRGKAHVLRSPMVLQCLEDYLAGKMFPLELLNSYIGP